MTLYPQPGWKAILTLSPDPDGNYVQIVIVAVVH